MLDGREGSREAVALEGQVAAGQKVGEHLGSSIPDRDLFRPAVQQEWAPLEGVELGLHCDVLAVEAHGLGHGRVARQAADLSTADSSRW